MRRSTQLLTVVILILQLVSDLYSEELCLYTDEQNKVHQVTGLHSVPLRHVDSAKCFQTKGKASNVLPKGLAAPKAIELGPQLRTASLVTNLGSISLRWPRSAEKLFGRTPERAVADAASAVSRALRKGQFPPAVKALRPEWQIVFMDAELPETQIPDYLRMNCHPGWMVPPGKIYIVAQRVAGVCASHQSPKSAMVADAELSQVLIHEFGHAVEAAFFGGYIPPDRRRAEGFATWFESYAADYSTVIRKGTTLKDHVALARQVFPRAFAQQFSGSAQEYAAASLLFHAVVERRGTAGLSGVYEHLAKDKTMNIYEAIEKETSWSEQKLLSEMSRFLEKK